MLSGGVCVAALSRDGRFHGAYYFTSLIIHVYLINNSCLSHYKFSPYSVALGA